jgi:hypothetical protein
MSDLVPEEAGLSEEFYALTHANLVFNYELAGQPTEVNGEAREEEAIKRRAPLHRDYMAKANWSAKRVAPIALGSVTG